MLNEARFRTGLDPPVLDDNWPETWEQTLYVWDEGDLQCLNCEKATIGEICLYCGMEIFTKTHDHDNRWYQIPTH